MNQSSTDRLSRWVLNWCDVSAEGLGLMRIFTALLLLFFLIPGDGAAHYEWLSGLPPELYAPPPGPMRLFEGFPPLVLFDILHSLLILSLLALLIGYRTKWASLFSGVLILILQGLIFSIGKIDHEILVPMVPLLMGFSNWGAAFSVDSLRKGMPEPSTENWPLVMLAVLTGFMMFTAGFPKILGGWLDPSTQATYGHVLNQFAGKERDALLAAYSLTFNQPWLWEILDWGTILFEIGFLVSVWKLRWFRFFLGIAVLFHFSTMMTMNIAFLPNFVAYALFLNWDGIYLRMVRTYQHITGRRGPKSAYKPVLIATFFTAAVFGLLHWLSDRDVVFRTSDLLLSEFVLVSVALLITAVLFLSTLMYRDQSENSTSPVA